MERIQRKDVRIKADENSGVAWFTPEEIAEIHGTCGSQERVYGKLIEKQNLKQMVDEKRSWIIFQLTEFRAEARTG